MRPIRHIVIHCSASANGDARVTADVIDQWHRERGWNGIGYHYVIHVDGTLHAGRPVEKIGAHVEGQNASSIGICMIGTDRFTAAQWEALATLVRGLQQRFPDAAVLGHRDHSPDKNGDGLIDRRDWLKICPGFDVRTWLALDMAPMEAHLMRSIE